MSAAARRAPRRRASGPARPARVVRSKARAREAVWQRLAESGEARFPYPPHGRIPNFAGAREAAERLLELPRLRGARRIKVNPDAPQRFLREAALRRGIEVFVPSPRLRGGFRQLDPARIPADELRRAASLAKGTRYARAVPLRSLPRMDAIVTGSVAVTRRGRRCGKGHGYSDLEYGILRALGQPEVPVYTTVHELQIVRALPLDATDLPLAAIATPERLIEVADPPPAPSGIDWSRVDEDALASMPVLRELRALASSRGDSRRGRRARAR